MSYYLRVLGEKNPPLPIALLQEKLEQEGLKASFAIPQEESDASWTICQVSNQEQELLLQIEKYTVQEEEVQEFFEALGNAKPLSSAEWLKAFFPKIQVVYAIQLLAPATEEANYPIVELLQQLLREQVDGIYQADYEGFTNKNGHQIVWQFPDRVVGEWNMALLNEQGEWVSFTMSLSDAEQKKEFIEGKVPTKAKLHENN